jgi:flagellar motor switch protein FliM
MVLKHQLSQQEIDSFFQTSDSSRDNPADSAVVFDFRRLDRIPKSQVSAIHRLHETFVRTLSASLSAYLRSFVSGILISVEQLPYSDFAEGLPSPTCLAYFGMQPYEGHTLIEVSPALVSSILDLILGGSGKMQVDLNREMTEVEQTLLEGFFGIIAHDLRETWKPIVSVNFAAGAIETSPQLAGRFVPSEAVVAIDIELRIGETTGTVKCAIPSITLKMMGEKFDQQWTVHKSANPAVEIAIKRRLARNLKVTVDCELTGPTIRLADLLNLATGDILSLSPGFDEPLDILVNGTPKFKGVLASDAKKRVAVIQPRGRRAAGAPRPLTQ